MKSIKYAPRFLRNFRNRISHNEQLIEAYKESIAAFRADRASVDDTLYEVRWGCSERSRLPTITEWCTVNFGSTFFFKTLAPMRRCMNDKPL